MILKLVVLAMLVGSGPGLHPCKHHHRLHQVTCANFTAATHWENHLFFEPGMDKFVLKNVNGSLHFSSATKFANVTYFSIVHSRLQEITLKNLPNLMFLSLVANQLPNLTDAFFEHTEHINWLALISNNHTVSPLAFQRLKQLTWLHIQNQRLVQLTAEFFKANSKLHELTIRNCQLETIDGDAFENATDLEALSLNYNRISAFQANTFANLTKLKILELHHNRFANFDFTQFQGLVSLEVLGLPTDFLRNIDVEQLVLTFPKIKKLEMRKRDLHAHDIKAVVKKIRAKSIQIIGTPHDCHLPTILCNHHVL